VRYLVIVGLGWLYVPVIYAQQQERSLVDRLLRPNMELQNNAQNKKLATRSVAIERRGTVGTFFLQPNLREKSFAHTGTLSVKEYSVQSFNRGSSNNSLENRSARAPVAPEASAVAEVHSTYDASKNINGRNFADQYVFREEGKSQKSLNRQNPPLTIEQVRELLNKNR
jgi:hypothetical protein